VIVKKLPFVALRNPANLDNTSTLILQHVSLPLARVSRLTSTYGSILRQGPRRRRPPSARDPRRRDPLVYTFLSSAQRTVLRRITGIYRARNAMLSPPSPPPIGSGDIVGDLTDAPSASFTRSSPLGTGTFHLVHRG